MRTLVIEQKALAHNLNVIEERAKDAVIYGVLNGDGGGAGLVRLAAFLRTEGITRFAVSELEEAAELRHAGFLDEEILMLRSTTDRKEIEELLDLDVVFTISSVDTGLALNSVAESRSAVAQAHIQIDTGLGFGGFLLGEPEKLLLAYRSLSSVALTGVYTQLHMARKKDPETAAQLKRFQQVLTTIHEAGFETGVVHAAGSFALLHAPNALFDGVRAGTVLLGRCCRTRDDKLQLVGHGEAALTEVRWLPKGHTVGRDQPIRLSRPTRIAVLPVGYQNGFGMERPRKLGFWSALRWCRRNKNRTVRIGNQTVSLIGPIGAGETLLDVTNVRCSAGDVACFDMDPMFAKGFDLEYR